MSILNAFAAGCCSVAALHGVMQGRAWQAALMTLLACANLAFALGLFT